LAELHRKRAFTARRIQELNGASAARAHAAESAEAAAARERRQVIERMCDESRTQLECEQALHAALREEMAAIREQMSQFDATRQTRVVDRAAVERDRDTDSRYQQLQQRLRDLKAEGLRLNEEKSQLAAQRDLYLAEEAQVRRDAVVSEIQMLERQVALQHDKNEASKRELEELQERTQVLDLNSLRGQREELINRKQLLAVELENLKQQETMRNTQINSLRDVANAVQMNQELEAEISQLEAELAVEMQAAEKQNEVLRALQDAPQVQRGGEASTSAAAAAAVLEDEESDALRSNRRRSKDYEDKVVLGGRSL
jgi:hypothetical protein